MTDRHSLFQRSETTLIRDEQPADVPAIRAVNQAAFGRPEEARLVDDLRSGDAP